MKLALALGVVGLCACAPPPAPTAPPAAAPAPVAEPAPDGVIPRPALDALLAKGPGELMDIVPLEDVLEGQSFVGWRVQRLPREWQGAGIEPGDIITSVNTMPIGRPEELWNVWTMLSVASEVKLAFMRDGQRGELRLPIWGSPDPGAQAAARAAGVGSGACATAAVPAPPPPPAVRPAETSTTGKGRKPTIVIRGDDKPLSEVEGGYR